MVSGRYHGAGLERERVVITGIGAVTPVGNDVATAWHALLAGRSGIAAIMAFDASHLPVGIAAEVRDFDADEVLGRREARKLDRVSHLAVAAAREAWTEAAIDRHDPWRTGVMIGSAAGGLTTIETQVRLMIDRGPNRLSPHFIPNMLVDTPGFAVAHDLDLRGPNLAPVSACASGAHSVAVATDTLRLGQADVMLAGGTEACVIELIVGGFCQMRALGSPRPGEPDSTASRPFDASRNGFTIGEGAVVLVLERLANARARGASIIAEVISYANTNDAFHPAAPREDGSGVTAMMEITLRSGGISADQVGYINPHGTSTPLNDPIETAAIRSVFGAHADNLLVSSTKSMTGHLFGAAGALETAVCALALRDQIVPPTINLRDPDPACDLDYVPNEARRVENLRYALTNSIGLGGHNGCLLLGRVDD